MRTDTHSGARGRSTMRRLPERVTAHGSGSSAGSPPGPSLTIKEVNNEVVVNEQDPPSPLSL